MVKTIQFVGFDDFDEFVMERIRKDADSLTKKYGKMFGEESVKELKFVVNPIHDGKGKDEYEVSARLDTTYGLFKVTKRGWNILKVFKEVTKDLVRVMTETKGKKIKVKRKLPANP